MYKVTKMWDTFLTHNNALFLKEWDISNEHQNLTCVLRKNIRVEDNDFQDFLQALLDISVQHVIKSEKRFHIDISRDTGGFVDEILFVYTVTKLTPKLIEIMGMKCLEGNTVSTLISV